jgi:hypothetical protein
MKPSINKVAFSSCLLFFALIPSVSYASPEAFTLELNNLVQLALEEEDQRIVSEREHIRLKLENEETLTLALNQAVQDALSQEKESLAMENAIIQAIAKQVEIDNIALSQTESNSDSIQNTIKVASNTQTQGSNINTKLTKNLQTAINESQNKIQQQVSQYRKTLLSEVSNNNSQHNNTPTTQLAKQASSNSPLQVSVNKKVGWIYIGQYINNSWAEKILNIDKKLPSKGKDYKLDYSVHMRAKKPSRLSKVMNTLASGDQVKILDIRPSGKQGHYWASVELLARNILK